MFCTRCYTMFVCWNSKNNQNFAPLCSSEPAAHFPECSSEAGPPTALEPPECRGDGGQQSDEAAAAADGERKTEAQTPGTAPETPGLTHTSPNQRDSHIRAVRFTHSHILTPGTL